MPPEAATCSHILMMPLKIILFCACIVLVYNILSFFAVDTNSANRLLYHDFYTQDEIDFAMVGASAALRGFHPDVADEMLGMNTFNLGTPSQTMDGTYYQTKELLDRYNPKTVVIDVSFCIMQRNVGEGKTTWIMTDYMRGINKYKFIFDVIEPENYLTVLSPLYRNRKNININTFIENYNAKTAEGYNEYIPYSDIYTNYNIYVNKGYGISYKENDGYDFFCYPESYSEFDTVDDSNFDEEEFEYLKKTIEMCQEQGVEVILVTAPKTAFYNSKSGDYDRFRQEILKIKDEYQIKYYDFNLIKDVNFDEECFSNLDHLTEKGAKLYTTTLCELYIDEASYDFYDSLDEVPEKGILGICYKIEKSEIGVYNLSWNVETDDNSEYNYRIIVKDSRNNDTMRDSGIISKNSIMLNILSDQYIEIELYDGDTFVGNALFLNLKLPK